MNAGISWVDSGESYLMPCFIDRDLRSLRAVERIQELEWEYFISLQHVRTSCAL